MMNADVYLDFGPTEGQAVDTYEYARILRAYEYFLHDSARCHKAMTSDDHFVRDFTAIAGQNLFYSMA